MKRNSPRQTESRAEIAHVLTVVSGVSEELLDVVLIEPFDLEAFREQFDVPSDDPEMRDRYGVGPDDADFLKRAIGRELTFDFSTYAYFIEAARR